MGKDGAICITLFVAEDLFYLKSFPCKQETSDSGSCAQKLERLCKVNDFEVLDPRLEIKFSAP